MKDLTIKIEFFSPWNCSSGLSAGADADSLVIKDKDGLPYLPGKTVKGLIREAVEDYVSLSGRPIDTAAAFGKEAKSDTADSLPQKGTLFFSNASLDKKEACAILEAGTADFLYINRASTAIDKNTGIAQDHSLRTIETTVPCTLYAHVMHVEDDLAECMKQALGLIKHIGTGRNRGMGRCRFSIVKIEKGGNT